MATTLRTLLGPTVGARQLFLQDMEQALDSSQQWLNHYLPLGERQAGKRPWDTDGGPHVTFTPRCSWGSPHLPCPGMLLLVPKSPLPHNAAGGVPPAPGCCWGGPHISLTLDAAGGQDPQHPMPSTSSPAEAKAAEGLDLASAGALRHGHPVPLSSLSEDARSRALALLQQLWQERLDAHHLLTQLQHILDMVRANGLWCWGGGSPLCLGTPVPTVPLLPQVEAMQEGLEGPLHNSQEPWECRNAAQADPCPHSACPHGQARSAEGSGTPMMLQALDMGRMLAQWLQDTLVQAVWRAQSGMAKVHATVSQAGSLWELLGTVVARGRKVVAQAWETLVVFTLQHLSLPWLEDAGMAALRVTPPHPQN